MDWNDSDSIRKPTNSTAATLPGNEPASASLKALLFIFIFLLIIVLGYFVYLQNNSTATIGGDTITAKNTSTEKSTAANSDSATTPAAEGKTYSDTTNGFSVQYPTNSTADSTSVSGQVSFGDLARISVASTTADLDTYIANKKTALTLSKEQKITFADQPAYEGLDLGAVNSYTIYIVKNGKVYQLIFLKTDKDTLEASRAELTTDQKLILNSFRFL